MTPLRFTAADSDRAFDTWGANCGPHSLAAVLGMTLDEVRPHLGDFESKGWMGPTLMWESLNRLKVDRTVNTKRMGVFWPVDGLARIQFEGPWTKPGVPARVAYGKTHWVGCRLNHGFEIFDCNAMDRGGWVPLGVWEAAVAPEIMEQIPKASGRWHLTHQVEIRRPRPYPP